MNKVIGLNKLVSAAFLASICLGASAQAAVLDFTGFSNGDTGFSSLDVGDATIDVTNGTVDIFITSAFSNGGFCGLSNDTCETDWTLTFDFAVTNLTLKTDGYDPSDLGEIQYFNGSTLLGSVFVDGDLTFDLGSAVITSLHYVDNSDGAGFSFGDFQYTVVPVPAAVWLFGSGFIGLVGFAGRKA